MSMELRVAIYAAIIFVDASESEESKWDSRWRDVAPFLGECEINGQQFRPFVTQNEWEEKIKLRWK